MSGDSGTESFRVKAAKEGRQMAFRSRKAQRSNVRDDAEVEIKSMINLAA
jgi:hypothetical protein